MSWRTPHGTLPLFKQVYPSGRMMGRVRLGLHARVQVVINQLIMKCTTTTNFSGSKLFVVRAHKQLGVSLVLVTPHMMSWPTSDGTSIIIGERLGAPTVAVVTMTLLRNRPMNLPYLLDLCRIWIFTPADIRGAWYWHALLSLGIFHELSSS